MNQDIVTLKQWIYDELFLRSPQLANFWQEQFQDDISTLTDESEVLRRVNLFWNIHLAKSDRDLFEVRNWLSDDVSIRVWKQRFLIKVIGAIVKHIKA